MVGEKLKTSIPSSVQVPLKNEKCYATVTKERGELQKLWRVLILQGLRQV